MFLGQQDTTSTNELESPRPGYYDLTTKTEEAEPLDDQKTGADVREMIEFRTIDVKMKFAILGNPALGRELRCTLNSL